jgi:membrane-anchored protein YejM (alkaline phosphatase superfamily)
MDQFNFLTIVVDSCRWDSFQVADTPNIDAIFEIVNAGAMATFTYPAHMSMFQGFFPTAAINRPIYNRFEKSVYRWFYKSRRPCLSELSGTGSIPNVLRSNGYRTVAIGGVGWFNKRTPMRLGFEDFVYETDGSAAIDEFVSRVDREPFYGLLNFGTTHRPYKVPGISGDLMRVKSPRSGNNYNSTFDRKLRDRQAACVTYTDRILVKLFDWLKSRKLRTVVCFCADHGDCMGEDNCYGHGFYHPSVMSIPLGWTVFMPGGESYPVTETNLKICGF